MTQHKTQHKTTGGCVPFTAEPWGPVTMAASGPLSPVRTSNSTSSSSSRLRKPGQGGCSMQLLRDYMEC